MDDAAAPEDKEKVAEEKELLREFTANILTQVGIVIINVWSDHP